MEVIILLHEQHIGRHQHQARHDQVDPVRQHRLRAQVDEAQGNHQLDDHIQQRDHHVAHPQLVRHQLVGVLAVRLAQVLVQHDAVDDGQRAVHPVHQEEHDVCNVLRRQHQAAQGEQDDERNADDGHNQVRRLNERCHVIPGLTGDPDRREPSLTAFLLSNGLRQTTIQTACPISTDFASSLVCQPDYRKRHLPIRFCSFG